MRFVNREKELNSLENWYTTPGAHLVILYGRRRVGKTQLCLEFIKDKPSIYFLAEKLPISHQLKHLSQKVGGYFKDDILATRGAADWEQLFKYLAEKEEPLVLVIDEFPYLVESEKGIAATFQKGWDLYLKDSPVFLILSGSSVSMMIEHTLGYKAPLYGRRSGQIQLQPFLFNALNQVFPRRSFEEKLLIFAIAGGIPAYLEVFADRPEPIKEILQETVFERDHFLSREVEFLLQQELREPRNYLAILTAIANKCTRLSEIMNATGFEKSTLSRYLSILQDLGFVKREVPVTEKYPSRSKSGSYQISDNFVKFWFQVVFDHPEQLEQGRKDFFLSQLDKLKTSLLAETYEQIAREMVRTSPKIFPRFERVGRWWSADSEIDVVGLNKQENRLLVGEVKWTKRPVDESVFQKLKSTASQIAWGDSATERQFALFSRSGFTKEMLARAQTENVVLVKEDQVVS